MDNLPILDLFHPDFVSNPGPMIERMLAEAPVAFDPRLGGWLVTRHRHVMALANDARLSSERVGYVSAGLSPELVERIQPLQSWYGRWIMMKDPPEHTRLRRLGQLAFLPRNITRLEPRIRQVADQLIDAVIDQGRMDVVRDFAFPLAQTIVSEIVGVPASDRDQFLTWVANINALLSAALRTPEAIDRTLDTYREVEAYFRQLYARRLEAPVEEEVASQLVAAAQKDGFSFEEVFDIFVALMSAGYETTANLISNGLLLLLKNPSEFARLRGDSSLLPGAVEEMLRCEPSITLNVRLAKERLEIDGHTIEPGQLVYAISIAANRDPEVFPDPNRFDVSRENSAKHVSFGMGAHFCLGAPLARLEARIAFERLFERLPSLELPEQSITRLPMFIIRQLEGLEVRW